MSDNKNVVKMDKTEKKATASQSLAEFLTKNRTVLLVIVGVVVAAFVAYAVVVSVLAGSVKKGLDKVEVIEYSLTKDSADLDESVINSRIDTALSNLDPYLKKGGIVGARADMLAADIYMQKKDWSKALDLLDQAASKRKKTYLAALCNFNAGVCCEELGDNAKALEYYTKVCDDKNFVDRSRAYFSAARIKESLNDYEGAKALYEAIASLELSNDTWNDLAQTRLISLKAEGKIQ